MVQRRASVRVQISIPVIHSLVRLMSGPQPLPNRLLHSVRSGASSFNLQCPNFSLTSSRSCLRLLPSLSVTSILPLYPSCNNLFQKAVPTQTVTNPVNLPFFVVCTIFLPSLTPCNTSSFLTRSVQLIFFSLFHHHISEISKHFYCTFRSVPSFSRKQIHAPNVALC
jgi:hypothetical protein